VLLLDLRVIVWHGKGMSRENVLIRKLSSVLMGPFANLSRHLNRPTPDPRLPHEPEPGEGKHHLSPALSPGGGEGEELAQWTVHGFNARLFSSGNSLPVEGRGNKIALHPFHAFAAFLLAIVSLAAGASARADWPEFRGPTEDGKVAGNRGLPLHWSETENVKWKTAIPNRGWSTPVILDHQIWLTDATVDGHDFYAVCVDEDTGKVKFNLPLFHSDNPEPLGNGSSMNCYATPTAVLEPGRVYVHFGAFGTACLDTQTGKVLWKRDDLKCKSYRGPSSSVVSFGNLIILTFDGADLQYLAALDKKTGRTVWKTDRSVPWNDQVGAVTQMVREGDHRKAHSTPLIVRDGGSPLMLSSGAKAAYGYDPMTGKELWRVQFNDFSSAPRPVYGDGIAYFVTGMTKHELLAVKTDGKGDITDTGIKWRLGQHIGVYASPLLIDGLIYSAVAESFVTCVDTSTGEVVWTERIGGNYAASPVYADGRMYFFSEDGSTTVLKPGRTFESLAKNTLDDGFMASPAVDGKAFYLRTRSSLYRIEAAGLQAAKP
jgi:outer membrane protein assembly factor BamB